MNSYLDNAIIKITINELANYERRLDRSMFQLRLNFKLESSFLPRQGIDRLYISFFKTAAQRYDERFYNLLYDKSKSIVKPYTFSVFLPGAIYEKNRICLNDNSFTMFFSDADMGELLQFFEAFRMLQGVKHPMDGNSMTLTSIAVQHKEEIKESEVVVKMLSPLLVRRHDSERNTDKYYVYNEDLFSQSLKENIQIYIQKMNLAFSAEDFLIVPVKGKKIVHELFGRKVDGNLGIYKLQGSPELLNHLYLAGAGVLRSSGHGKFEVIG